MLVCILVNFNYQQSVEKLLWVFILFLSLLYSNSSYWRGVPPCDTAWCPQATVGFVFFSLSLFPFLLLSLVNVYMHSGLVVVLVLVLVLCNSLLLLLTNM